MPAPLFNTPPARRPRPRPRPKPTPRTLVIWPWVTYAGLGDLAHWLNDRNPRSNGLYVAVCGAVGVPCEDYDRQIVDACVDCDRSLRWELVH